MSVRVNTQFVFLIVGQGKHEIGYTRPKLRFPDVVVTKAHDLSYTCLVEDWAEFLKINEMCRKFCPILHISYMHEIHIFVL